MTDEEREALILRLRAEREAEAAKATAKEDGPKAPDVVSRILGVRAADLPPKRERQRVTGEFTPQETAEDVGKSIAYAPGKAVAALAGLPSDARKLANTGRSYIDSVLPDWMKPSDDARNVADVASRLSSPMMMLGDFLPGSQEIRGQVEKVTGPWHDPKTRAGKFADTFVQTAATGGPGVWKQMPGKMAALATTTAGGTEAAGALTDDDPWARFAGGVAGSGPLAFANAGRTHAGNVVNNAIGKQSASDLALAKLLEDLGISKKFKLTGDESLKLGGNPLSRYALSTLGGGQVMRDFYGRRPAETESLANRTLTEPTKNFDTPQENIPRAFRAAEDRAQQLRGNRSNVTHPWFAAGEQQLAGPDTLEGITQAALGQRPAAVYPEHFNFIDEQLKAFGGRPAMTGRQLQRAHVDLRDQAEALKNPQATSSEKSTAHSAEGVRDAVQYARDQLPGMAQGNALHHYYTQNVYDPLMEGPLGRLASSGHMKGDPLTSGHVEGAKANILDSKLVHPQDIKQLQQQLHAADPKAFPALVRSSFEGQIENALKNDVGGGAWKLHGAFYGTDTLRANTNEAMRGVARSHGLTGQAVEDYAKGVENMMKLFERTRSPHMGSDTATRTEMGKEMGKSTTADVMEGASLTKPIIGGFTERIRQWSRRGGDKELAEALTSERSVEALIKLAKLRPNSLTARYYLAAMLGLDRAITEP